MTDHALDMRGFTCAVSRAAGQPSDYTGAAGIAVGIDDSAGDRRYALALRHADGTVLTGFLSDALLDRLALRLANLVGDDPVPTGTATIQ